VLSLEEEKTQQLSVVYKFH